MTIRVLIADDQAMIRTGFRMILQSEPDIEVVGEASDGESAVRQAIELRPDVTVMDIRMPGLDGIEATRLLAGRHVADPLRVVVVTTYVRRCSSTPYGPRSRARVSSLRPY
jgi:DNA-binding NarL/FixJ family response regulator